MIRKLRAICRKFQPSEIKLSEVERRNVSFVETLSAPVTFICSYPRSGNTWLRYLMADCLLQKEGYQCDTDLPIHPDRLIPDLHCHDFQDNAVTLSGSKHHFYKSHFTSSEIANTLVNSGARSSVRYIYLYRSPADALISLYYYKLRYPESAGVAKEGPDAFCVREAQRWAEHVNQAVRRCQSRDDLCLIKYEDLHGSTPDILGEIWKWLRIEMAEQVCIRAASHMEFDKLQSRESRANASSYAHRFFRKGVIGGAAQDLSIASMEYIQSATSDVVRQADKVRLKPPLAQI